MNSLKTEYDAPFLKDTNLPTIISCAEYESGKAHVMARYPALQQDKVTFFLEADGGVRYEKVSTVAPGGETKGEVGTNINTAQDWELVGKSVNAYFVVHRNSAPLGESRSFTFKVLAS
ncbi:hypothetical protein C2E19_09360 [Pseudomonas sp. DTU12.3]|uniref:hypothetical protein n=1 Tax=Pseudomonas sp. DTU12.3 TaxID=2073078 RepID=UPI001010F6C2|nr:hypothetical protein [Pseudomonas sp. DTU12.3]QAX84054.1 hypothetical protein C2E19_09360 [Pseudomonas sp. DTU12.3]